MARYIDADKIEYTETVVGMDEYAGYRTVVLKNDIDAMPTADVVPRSEADKWKSRCAEWHEVAELKSQRSKELEQDVTRLEQENESLKDTVEHLAVFLKDAKADAAVEIFEELFDALCGKGLTFTDWIELQEIRKKYIGEADGSTNKSKKAR